MAWEPYDSRGRPNTPKSNPHDISLAAEPLRSRAEQMRRDCPYPGELGYSSIVRDPGTQWDFRDERVGRANIWKFPPRGNPTTAVPARWNAVTGQWEGGSKHQTGHAVDFAGTERAMVWMMDNREAYGLAHTVSSERWHQEANARDTITGRIHDHPTVPVTPFADHGEPTKPKEWTDMATEAEVQKAITDGIAAALAPLTAKVDATAKQVNVLHEQWIGTKGKAGPEALRQLLREDAADSDAVEKRTRPAKP